MLVIPKNIIKAIPYIIIVLLIAALSITQCSKQKFKAVNHDSELIAAIGTEKKRIIDLENRGQQLIQKLKSDSLKNSASLRVLKRENKALRKEIVISRTNIQYVIDSIPAVDHFVDLTDSLDVIQEATIDSLENQGARQWTAFNSILSVEQEKFKASSELVKHFEEVNKDLEKRVKRERAKKTVWKIAAGLIGGALLYSSVSN